MKILYHTELKKQREKIEKSIQCDKDVYEIYKIFNIIKTEELKELFENEFISKLQTIRHKLQQEINESEE